MRSTDASSVIAISDTGPLISIFQSGSIDLVGALFGRVHTSIGCIAEIQQHGWEDAILKAESIIASHMLTSAELAAAQELARRVAKEFAKPTVPNDHIGEAEVMILAQRQEFADGVLLIDELAARRVALTLNLRVSGFAGILLVAVEKGLLTADAVQERLLHCQQQGTYYGAEFIQRVYEQAKEGKR